MDIFSHALWGATIVRKKPLVWWALLFGALPDLISTGMGALYFFATTGSFLPSQNWWLFLPEWSKTLYFLSHSVLGAALVFAILRVFGKTLSLLALPYTLHIVMDLITHETDHFSRLLYPFVASLPERVSGFNWWEHRLVLLVNFALLLAINAFLWYNKRKRAVV